MTDQPFTITGETEPVARTLEEITLAIRAGEPHTEREARYAVVAYDVLMAKLSTDKDIQASQMNEYGRALDLPPLDYIGPDNDPENPAAVRWLKAMSDCQVPAVDD